MSEEELLNKLKINPDFDIPYYIFEEIINYVERTALGHSRCSQWSNIQALLRLAIMNERLTKTQADFLIETYCREKDDTD